MNLKDILAVSGMPGLYKLVNTRSNGLQVTSLDDSTRTIFCSTRKHQFTPMETVAIYTMVDTIELSTIFERMLDQLEENPPALASGDKEEIENYFSSIVPDYDEDRVYISDMKKVLKWFVILNEKGFLAAEPEADPKPEADTKEESKAKPEPKAKSEKKVEAKKKVKKETKA